MAYFSFTDKIVNGKLIEIYDNGDMMRDFTYIDDIVEGVIRLIPNPPKGKEHWSEINGMSTSWAPYKVYNIGNSSPVQLIDFVKAIERHLGMKTEKIFLLMQNGDVKATYADVSDLEKDIGFSPSTTLDKGIGNYIKWYKKFYKVK